MGEREAEVGEGGRLGREEASMLKEGVRWGREGRRWGREREI